MKKIQILLIFAVVGIFINSISGLPLVGDKDSPAATHVSPRYIEKSYEETGSKNLVTAVLADYRAYDTLGETVVIFTAGLATVLILKVSQKEK